MISEYKKELKLFEAFAGIGSQLTALKNIEKKSENFFIKPVGISEWDIYALETYFYINSIKINSKKNKEFEKKDFINFFKNNDFSKDSKNVSNLLKIEKNILKEEDILKKIYFVNKNSLKIFPNIKKVSANDLKNLDIDIFTYSFPCQDLSSAGKMKGFQNENGEKTRSGLLYEIERILKEYKKNKINLPKYLLLENVSMLFSKKYIDEYLSWKKFLKKLGYVTFDGILNSDEYGISQSRKRAFAVSILKYKGNLKKYLKKDFDKDLLKNIILESNYKKKRPKKIENIIKNDEEFDEEVIKSIPNHTNSRNKMWEITEKKLLTYEYKNNLEFPIYAEKSRTLTTKQDRWNNAGMIELSKEQIKRLQKKYEYLSNKEIKYRFITKRESLLLMGFNNNQINKFLNKSNQQITKIWHQAGNSIVVNVLEAIFTVFIQNVEENNDW